MARRNPVTVTRLSPDGKKIPLSEAQKTGMYQINHPTRRVVPKRTVDGLIARGMVAFNPKFGRNMLTPEGRMHYEEFIASGDYNPF